MDADDRLDEENRRKLKELFAQLPQEIGGYVMKCLCLPNADTGIATLVDHVRLFTNHHQIRWSHRIHEQILPGIRMLKGEVRWCDVTVHHVGYQNTEVRKRKLERDLRLLTLEHDEQPNHPFTLFNLAQVLQEQGKTAEALNLLQRSLQQSAPEDSIVRKLYALIIQCHRHLGQLNEALKVCQEGRLHYPDNVEILFQEGLTRGDLKDFRGAIACLERMLTHREENHFSSVDMGLCGYKARHNLALFLQEEGRLDEAVQQWKMVLEEQPQFLPALVALAELLLSRRDWAAFDSCVQQLRQSDKGTVEALVLEARKYLVMGDFSQGRQSIDKAIGLHPQLTWPRVVRTHILLQEGKDWQAAESALRDVLKLDPNHAEARRNLDVLLRQQGKA